MNIEQIIEKPKTDPAFAEKYEQLLNHPDHQIHKTGSAGQESKKVR